MQLYLLPYEISFGITPELRSKDSFTRQFHDLHPPVISVCLCYSCFEANLNGEFYSAADSRDEFRGLIWEHWLGDVSLKRTEMKIKSPDVTKIQDPEFEDRSAEVQPDGVRPLDIPEDP
jgi:hypothetical protein